MNTAIANVSRLFGCTAAQARRQYARNAVQLRSMANKANAGKYRGKTAAQWQELAKRAEELSQ